MYKTSWKNYLLPSLLSILSITAFFSCSKENRSNQKKEEVTVGRDTIKKESLADAEIYSARTLGLAFLEENKLEEAEEEFLKVINFAPNDVLGYANLGLVYLRMNELEKAEDYLKMAINIDPNDPDIRLNLAKVYELDSKEEASIEELKKSEEVAPEHVQTLFGLAESYKKSSDLNSTRKWQNYLSKLVNIVPMNIIPRLYLIESFLAEEKHQEALGHLEELGRIFPEFPAEASEYYQIAISDLQATKMEEAKTSFAIFHNFLKLSNSYQSGIRELRGTGSTLGNPVITFSNSTAPFFEEGESILDAIQFRDVTVSAGLDVFPDSLFLQHDSLILPAILAVADMDRDGDQDIYLSSYSPVDSVFRPYLFNNNFGRFENVISTANINHSGVEESAVFADYNNDGHLDLYVVRDGNNLLYKNVNVGKFQEVGDEAGVGESDNGNKAVFFDYDHEGDLDLFIAKSTSNAMCRNNGNGTFKESSKICGLGENIAKSRDVAFGDFDDDGDLDLFVVNENGSNRLYANERQGKYKDVTAGSGLGNRGENGAVACGDYNGDGLLDIFVTGINGVGDRLYKNKGEGIFERDIHSSEAFSVLNEIRGYDVTFFDFDNDGYLDLLIVGEGLSTDVSGIQLFHNDQKGGFENVSYLLTRKVRSGHQLAVADYNEDGDLDIFIAGLHGGMHLLRNDGGNINHHIKVQLVGIRTGSGKNNHFGIGSKIEVRAGDHYQVKVVEQPNVHFGLGQREKVDVVRIIWTNGVPQNIFSPSSDQDLIEEQELKGSCPFLYTWNGEKFIFTKDVMWRSALGMPLGILGESASYAFPDASDDFIKIPSESLKVKEGKYAIQLTAELWETMYYDKVKLVAVDHPESVDVFVNESFSPPPFPELKLYQVEEKKLPIGAADGVGNDLLELIRKRDDHYISNFKKTEYQGIVEMKDLILDLGAISETNSLFLFLNGWIFPTDASINVAISQSGKHRIINPYLQLRNENGEWVTVIENIGFPMGKDKTVVVDLSGKFLSNDHRVRIRTNLEIYWDYIFFSDQFVNHPQKLTFLAPSSADLHYRGFSRMYRKGGRYGPNWFDYYEVSTDKKWNDQKGNYTRFGDVLPLLLKKDNQYVIANAGNEITIEFDSSSLPELPSGWKRDFLINTVGWVKDGDINTVTGNQVKPLPFHGMKIYPYEKDEIYPDDIKSMQYLKQYNTRIIND